jgi:hypothetical protein
MYGKKTKEQLIFIKKTGLLLLEAMTLKSPKLIQTQTIKCFSGFEYNYRKCIFNFE